MFRTEAKFLVRRVKILDTPRLSSLSLPISTLVFSPFPLETFANSYLSPETFSDGNERHSILDGDSRLSPRRHFESKKKEKKKKKRKTRFTTIKLLTLALFPAVQGEIEQREVTIFYTKNGIRLFDFTPVLREIDRA